MIGVDIHTQSQDVERLPVHLQEAYDKNKLGFATNAMNKQESRQNPCGKIPATFFQPNYLLQNAKRV